MSSIRVLYFGMPVGFSGPPLRRLIESDLDVCAAVLPKSEGGGLKAELPQDSFILHPSAFSLVVGDIPVIEVGSLKEAAALDRLAACRPDVICVACFPMIFPPALLAVPPLGCLNLHPSLLPRYRGPAPLFWQFRAGETETGVTVHFMDRGADTGDIALQRRVHFPDGLNGEQVDRLCAEAGGELLVEAVRLLGQGRCPRVKQSEAGVAPSAAPWPAASDFEMSPAWPARRAFNFARGTAHWGMPYEIRVGEERLLLTRALSYSLAEKLERPWRAEGRAAAVQFADGVVYFEAA